MLRKFRPHILFVLCFTATLTVSAQMLRPSFKIVGYYSLQAAMAHPTDAIPLDKLTHVNLWFLNPDSGGNFTQDLTALAPFVAAAHNKGVKVLVSIGGGSAHPVYHGLLQSQHRPAFIQKLGSLVLQHQLDGLDVDLEGSDIDENYEAFVTGLAAVLRPQKKLLTAAIAVYYKDALTDKALAQFDFMNIMSYDRTGPWRPEKPGPHATYAHAAEDLAYFATQRKLPKQKLVMGVPFYGYGFGPDLTSPAISMDYGQIIARFPHAEKTDTLKMPDGKILYYNGAATIRKKTVLAQQKASGIMIWQVKGDAPGAQSLLRVIHRVATKRKK